MNYTTLDLIKSYGGNVTGIVDDTLIQDTLIPGYSAQVDEYCHQYFGAATYADQVLPAHIDRDGVMVCYPPVPTLTAPTAVAWRYGRLSSWVDIDASMADVEPRQAGAIVRILDRDYGEYRGRRVQMRLSYSGGYADTDSLPRDFLTACTRLVWWAYKLREAPLSKTAMPGLGQVVIPPSGWPGDVRDALRPYVRRTI